MQHVKKLPGFRSGSRRNAIIASVVYVLVIVAIINLLTGGGSDDAEPAEAAAPTATMAATSTAVPATSAAVDPTATATSASTRPVISDALIDDAVDLMLGYELVSDAAVVVDGDTVILSLIVNAAIRPDIAQQRLEGFARYLAGQVGQGLRTPDKDGLGELWEHYDLELGAGIGDGSFIARGSKSKLSPTIRWQNP